MSTGKVVQTKKLGQAPYPVFSSQRSYRSFVLESRGKAGQFIEVPMEGVNNQLAIVYLLALPGTLRAGTLPPRTWGVGVSLSHAVTGRR
jgi:hypothetical protein